MKAVIV